MAIANYEPYSPEAIKSDAAHADDLSGGSYLKIEPGHNYIRILPGMPGKSPFRMTHLHYVELPGGKRAKFACLRTELKQACPACTESDRLRKQPNAQLQEEGWKIAAKLQVFCSAIHRAHPDRGVQLWAIGKSIWKGIQAIITNPRSGGDCTNPLANGFDICVHRTGTGPTDTEYQVSADRMQSPLADTEDDINMLLEARLDLDAQVVANVPEALQLQWQAAAARHQVGQARAGFSAGVQGKPLAQQLSGGSVGANVMRARTAPITQAEDPDAEQPYDTK